MTGTPIDLTRAPDGYECWLAELKTRIHTARQRASLVVNREQTLCTGRLAAASCTDRLAHDLRTAFPEMKGFSRANLMYMRAFATA